MKLNLNKYDLTNLEKTEVENLLKNQKISIQDDLTQIWYLMDAVWDELGCDNVNLNWDKIGKFYSHPVWLLNGLFIEQHQISMMHRNEISDWVAKNKFKNIVDYGGGFGTLARLIAKKTDNSLISIYEPYPSDAIYKINNGFDNILIIKELNNQYDCLISTDVLEHVNNPIATFSKMIDCVKENGYLIIANCFEPVIKCHLPSTFHLKYTFNIFASILGLENCGQLQDTHATIYRKISDSTQDLDNLKYVEALSKMLYPFFEKRKPLGDIDSFNKLIFEAMLQPLRALKRWAVK